MRHLVPPAALALLLAAGLPAGGASAPAPEVLAASPAGAVQLSTTPVRVEIALPAAAETRLEEVAVQKDGRLRLAIEGLQLLQPGAVFEVYLNLPAGQKPARDSPYRLGNLALFTERQGAAGITRTFDVTERIRALRQHGQWAGRIELTFVRQDLSGKTLAGPGGAGAFLRFNRVSLLTG